MTTSEIQTSAIEKAIVSIESMNVKLAGILNDLTQALDETIDSVDARIANKLDVRISPKIEEIEQLITKNQQLISDLKGELQKK